MSQDTMLNNHGTKLVVVMVTCFQMEI